MISGSISGGTTGLEIDNSTTFSDYDLGSPYGDDPGIPGSPVTEATTSTIVGNTLGNFAFADLSGNYITLADGALGGMGSPTSFNGTTLDASGVSFDGQLGASLTTASGPLTASTSRTRSPTTSTIRPWATSASSPPTSSLPRTVT